VKELTIRDDRINQEDQDEYARASQQATTQSQEVASARETASDAQVSSSDIIRRLVGISGTLQALTTRVARLEARSGGQATATSQPSPSSRTSAPVSTTTPADAGEPVSNRPAGSESSSLNPTSTGINRAVGTVAEDFPWPWAFPPPPPPVLSRTQGPDFINGPNGNAFIDTVAHLVQSGQLQATTHVQATNLFGGVTTGTLAVVADESGRIIARSGLQQIGVDGTWIPFKESNRTVQWTEEFGPDVAARGRALYVAHFHAGRNRLVEDITSIFGVVVTVYEFVVQFCDQNPDICESVSAAFSSE